MCFLSPSTPAPFEHCQSRGVTPVDAVTCEHSLPQPVHHHHTATAFTFSTARESPQDPRSDRLLSSRLVVRKLCDPRQVAKEVMNGRCTPPQHAFIQVIERAINGVPAAMMLAVIPERDSGSFRGLPPDRGDPADGTVPSGSAFSFCSVVGSCAEVGVWKSWLDGWCGRSVESSRAQLLLGDSVPANLEPECGHLNMRVRLFIFSLLPDMGTVPVDAGWAPR